MKTMPLSKSFIMLSALTLATIIMPQGNRLIAQTLQRSGRLWAFYSSNYDLSLSAFANVYDLSNNTLLGSTFLGPTGGPNGNGNARAIAFDPTDGNMWFSTLLPGSINIQRPNGDGLIHKKAALGGPDISTIPDPGGVGGPGIGALDFDPEENVLWATTYWPANGQMTLYKLNPTDGSVLKTLSTPFQSSRCCGNTTLAIARPADLQGAKVLLTTAGYEGSLTLRALDVNSGAIIKTYFSPFISGPVYGIDADDVTGDLVIVNGFVARNLGPAPYVGGTGTLNIQDRIPEYILGRHLS